MRLTLAKLAVPLGAALLLAACEEQAEEPRPTQQGGQAAGKVLGGTISDDMLPLERLRSQSPPMEREPGEGGTAPENGAEDEAGEPEAEAETEADAPAPASTGLPVAPPAPQ